MEIGRKYPIGVQGFDKIIKKNYVYVDKTELIYRLVKSGEVYFLSRPRRFGKSLLLSTLKAYFEGKKELFKGLAIEKLEKEWIQYPVLRLDFSGENFTSPEALNDFLINEISQWEKEYGREETETTVALRFKGIIRRACMKTGKKVVILVDEYDKPMLDAIDDESLLETYRNILRGFYGVLKPSDDYLTFVFLTGITKFAKLSIFSDLNQLNDISMDSQFDTLCGITEDELHQYFKVDIRDMAKLMKMSYDDVLGRLKEQYDGYHFSRACRNVYNPFSLLNTFYHKEFSDYWFQTGTPLFLVKFLQRTTRNISKLNEVRVLATDFTNYRVDDRDPIPVLYQSGYLTIRDYDPETQYFTLGYPNNEVYNGLLNFIRHHYFHSVEDNGVEIHKFHDDLLHNDIDSFMTRFQSFVSGIDYSLFDGRQAERDYQFIFILLFTLIGMDVKAEVHTSGGRMDALILTPGHIYIFEFKLDRSAEEALEQIDMKRYGDRFASDRRPIVKVGANFSSEHRTLDKWAFKC